MIYPVEVEVSHMGPAGIDHPEIQPIRKGLDTARLRPDFEYFVKKNIGFLFISLPARTNSPDHNLA